MPKFLTQVEFIEKAKSKHGDKYDYTNTIFTATKNNIVYKCKSCNIEIIQSAKGHLEGYGCSTCGQKNRKSKIQINWDQYIKIANFSHNNYYTYSNTNVEDFNNREQKLENTIILVTCPIHGDFTVNADRHIKKDRLQGCQKCRIDTLIKEGKIPGGYCETLFSESEYLATQPGILYYLSVGTLYKIGITTNLKNRITSIKTQSKKEVEVLFTYNTSLKNAFTIEQTILMANQNIRTARNWSTELFTECVLTKIKKEIQNVEN